MIVTRDVADRYRGFLASVMLEVAPTVYVSPRMNPRVRTRTWDVLADWHSEEPRGSITMVWRDANETGGIGIESLGESPRKLIEVDGTWLVKKML
ncbi:type I-E CRISPR-associated endoribonuclease Cas2e [Aromatoleum buckelii]|nr:type I-E CRISPR-associated endoribonuclease Cas2e [Aromatoleum buckelii]MCK0509953.1 type I-E CRISPR-associated endoribonuclease Cas2e [Aromatoleum buckelii]